MPRRVWLLGFATLGCLVGAAGLALPLLAVVAFDAAIDVSVYDPQLGADPVWQQERLRVWFVAGLVALGVLFGVATAITWRRARGG